MTSISDEHEEHATEIAVLLSETCIGHDLRIAVAESLTGGRISSHLAAAPDSGKWFAGGVVAYASDVKHTLLAVPAGPVISQVSVETMARTVADLMGADLAVAASGAGGPVGQEGQEPGTTWIAVLIDDQIRSEIHHLSGEPIEVLAQTAERALTLLWETLEKRLKQQGSE